MSRSPVIVWREALRDSDLSLKLKAVGFVLSTYMNKDGVACPGRAKIASGCSLTEKPVDEALRELEAREFLAIDRTDGGRGKTNVYTARLPGETVEQSLHRFEPEKGWSSDAERVEFEPLKGGDFGLNGGVAAPPEIERSRQTEVEKNEIEEFFAAVDVGVPEGDDFF